MIIFITKCLKNHFGSNTVTIKELRSDSIEIDCFGRFGIDIVDSEKNNENINILIFCSNYTLLSLVQSDEVT